MANYIEFVLMKHLDEIEQEIGDIKGKSDDAL